MHEPFGERLARLRLRHGYSMRKLEQRIGVPHGTISRLERQSRTWPSVPVAIKLARELRVTVDYLVGASGNFDEPAG